MKTLDRIGKDYVKNILLRDCQMQAFEYLFEKKGDLYIVIFCIVLNLLQKYCHMIFTRSTVLRLF